MDGGSASGNRNSRLATLMVESCDWVSLPYNKTALALQVKACRRWGTI
jgi:hypothetical protein